MGELRRRDGSRRATGRDVLVVAWLCLLVVLGAAAPAGAASLTNSGSDLRDGWYPDQPALSPDAVGGGTFGQLWQATVDGQVYMQPLVLGQRVIVATERNKVYSLDAQTGAQAWTKSLGAPYQAADVGCGDLTPDLGVTSTPVIDPATNTVYLTHKTYVSGTTGAAAWWMDALDAATGSQRAGFPVRIGGTAQNAPGMTFDAKYELQRPGLLLMGGVVYAAFGGHCDITPYQGWVFGVSTAGVVKARWSAVTSGSGAGIWQSGAGLMSDGPGRIFLSTGNGGAPAPPLATPNGMFGESVVRLAVQGDGTLKAQDFFAPYDAAKLDEYDADFASGGVTALRDDAFGTTSHPHLAVAVGKAGYVYLLDRDRLGGIGMGPSGGDDVLGRTGPDGGVWSRPGVWPGDGGWVIVPTASGASADGPQAWGSSGFLKMYQYGESAAGVPSLALRAQSDDPFGFGSSAPVITSDATKTGTALAWVIWSPDGSGVGAQLRAYDAVPTPDGRLRLRWSAPVGQAAKFAMPGVGDGRIYTATRDGKVTGFGAPVAAAVQAPATTFPVTTVGDTSTQPVTLTAGRAVTITGITSGSAAFAPALAGLGLPRTLDAGQTLAVPVSFAPAQPGVVGGTLTVATDQGSFAFGLSGTGQAQEALLTATPPTLSFGGAIVGDTRAGTVTFGNGGGQPLTISGVAAPGAPFSAPDAPAVGATIAPGASITVTVRYQPTAAGPASGELTLQTTAGAKTIGLSGSAGLGPHLAIDPVAGWTFGDIEVGTSKTASVVLSNTGDSPMSITKSKPPLGAAFEVLDALPEGSTLPAGASRTLRIRFTPTAAGEVASSWTLNAADGTGVHEVAVTGTGMVAAPAAPTGGAGGAPSGGDTPGDGGTTAPAAPSAPGPDATAVLDAPALTPALIGPGLVGGQGVVVPEPKVRADLTVLKATLGRDGRRVTVTGRANAQAAGALSVTLQARRAGRRTVTVTTSGRLARGRFTVRLDLPRSARTWRSLHVLVRFGGSDRAWAAAGSLVVVHGR
jgi:iron transport multicopper oxidase